MKISLKAFYSIVRPFGAVAGGPPFIDVQNP